jgi:hypothetical protein
MPWKQDPRRSSLRQVGPMEGAGSTTKSTGRRKRGTRVWGIAVVVSGTSGVRDGGRRWRACWLVADVADSSYTAEIPATEIIS